MLRRSKQTEMFSTSVLNSRPFRRSFFCCLIVILVSLSVGRADDPARSYFKGLRQRHLFGIAEGYCLNRLTEPRLSDTDRARYTLELARTLAAHAMVAKDKEQNELWDRAKKTLTQIVKDNPNWADAPVFNAEHARIAAQQADILYWQTKAVPYNEMLKNSAISKLSQANLDLVQAEIQLYQLLKKFGSFQNFTVLKTATIRDTLLDFQLLIAQTKIKLADLSDAQSPQRKSHLQSAIKILEPLSRRASTLEVTWRSKLALIQCDRIGGDSAAATRAIKAIIKEKPPAYIKEAIFAESIWILLSENKAQQAARQIIKFRQDHGRYSSELGYLEVDALIRLRKVALAKKQASLAEEIWQQIEMRSQQLGKSQPGYWAQRTRILVNQQNQIDQYGSRISQNLKQAQLLYSQGKIDQAITAYDQVAAQAAEQGKTDLAFELGFTSASLQLRSKQYKQAAAQFQSLALRFDAAPKAGDASLLAAWCLGQLYTQNRTKSRRLTYTEALERVRKHFPDSDSAYEAGWMLARLEESRLQYSKALVLYSEIPDKHAKAADAHLGIARCYENILLRLTSLKKTTHAWRREAIEVLENFLADFPDHTNNTKLKSQTEIALRLTRIYLNDTPPLYAKANRLLELIVHTTKTTVSNLRRNNERSEASVSQKTLKIKNWNGLLNQALRLQIIALAGQGNPSAARSLVESLETAGTDELLSVLNGISQINLDLTPEVRRELGMLQLKSAEKLVNRRDELKPEQIKRLDLCLAEAYLAIDQPIRALEYYQTLLKQSPNDASLIKQVALLLERCGTKQCLQQASQKWQSLITAEKPGTLRWLDIRLHIIQTSFDSGNEAKAKKLLGVTKLLYPELGNVEMKRRYNEMQDRIK
ncbi:MAG: tetratricopeptide repeat protein, partial [Gimesia sp.]